MSDIFPTISVSRKKIIEGFSNTETHVRRVCFSLIWLGKALSAATALWDVPTSRGPSRGPGTALTPSRALSGTRREARPVPLVVCRPLAAARVRCRLNPGSRLVRTRCYCVRSHGAESQRCFGAAVCQLPGNPAVRVAPTPGSAKR